jgi:hypothetical protein
MRGLNGVLSTHMDQLLGGYLIYYPPSLEEANPSVQGCDVAIRLAPLDFLQ